MESKTTHETICKLTYFASKIRRGEPLATIRKECHRNQIGDTMLNILVKELKATPDDPLHDVAVRVLDKYGHSNTLTYRKRIAPLLKADGTPRQDTLKGMYQLLRMLSGAKYYYNSWTGTGGWHKLATHEECCLIANCCGFDLTSGNDAPRGGAEGEFYALDGVNKRKARHAVKVLESCIDVDKLADYNRRHRGALIGFSAVLTK